MSNLRNTSPSPYSTQSRPHVSACFRGRHLDNLAMLSAARLGTPLLFRDTATAVASGSCLSVGEEAIEAVCLRRHESLSFARPVDAVLLHSGDQKPNDVKLQHFLEWLALIALSMKESFCGRLLMLHMQQHIDTSQDNLGIKSDIVCSMSSD